MVIPRCEPAPDTNLVTSAVIRAAMAVHRALGPGFLESVYEEALCIELRHSGVEFVRQRSIDLAYRNEPVGTSRIDLLVGGCVIVELKCVEKFADIHRSQVISYLRATGLEVGLLLNFNTSRSPRRHSPSREYRPTATGIAKHSRVRVLCVTFRVLCDRYLFHSADGYVSGASSVVWSPWRSRGCTAWVRS
jgi:GxxExxY protein